jgi:type IV pilus assembly protein PilQ
VLELKVTPTITNDGRVSLRLNVKKDEVAELIQTPQGIVPAITKREINTQVLVMNGETVVLGGVYEISSREDLQKVPLLGDVPVLGNLFRNRQRQSSKAELLIFVTPKLLRDTLQ